MIPINNNIHFTSNNMQPHANSALTPSPLQASNLPAFHTQTPLAFVPSSIVERHHPQALLNSHQALQNTMRGLPTSSALAFSDASSELSASARRDLQRDRLPPLQGHKLSSSEPEGHGNTGKRLFSLLPDQNKQGCSASAESAEDKLNRLTAMRTLPKDVRFEILKNLSPEARRELLESGLNGDAVVTKIIERYDWSQFQLDRPGVQGILSYALLCKLVYLSDNAQGVQPTCFDKSFQTLMDAGFTLSAIHDDVVETSKMSNRVLLLTKEDQAILVVRGTQSGKDTLTNINMFCEEGKAYDLDGEFHKGYFSVFKKVWPQIEQFLNEQSVQQNGKPIRLGIVGHSMGCAMATMMAEKAEQMPNMHVEKVVTLGGVKSFNKKACDQYEAMGLKERTTRVVNYVDIVTLAWPHFDHPPANTLFLTKNGRYWHNPNWGDVLKNQIQRFASAVTNPGEADRRLISDHDLDDYIETLYIHSNDSTTASEDEAKRKGL